MRVVFQNCKKICCVESNAYFVRKLDEKRKDKDFQDMEVDTISFSSDFVMKFMQPYFILNWKYS